MNDYVEMRRQRRVFKRYMIVMGFLGAAGVVIGVMAAVMR